MNAKSSVDRATATPSAKEPEAQERAMLIHLYSQGQFADAEAVARDMTQRFPKHVLGWKVLGAVLKQTGRVADAVAPMQKAVALAPRDHEAYNNLGVAHKESGRMANAVGCFQQAVALHPEFVVAWSNLGSALHDQGELPQALRCYRRVLELTPDDLNALHHVNALSGHTSDRAPAPYVSGVFDHYAGHFDQHLQGHLGYAVPQEMARLLRQHPPAGARPWSILDLGCGTGLVGQALQSDGVRLIGVDLSARMLALAKAKGVYERVVQSDLLTLLEGEPAGSIDVVTSADVFIYVGRIDREVEAIRLVLKPGGVFAFSVESWQAPAGEEGLGFVLQSTCRYGHSEGYLASLAHANGFDVLVSEAMCLRKDGAVEVPGSLQVWRLK